MCLFKTQTCATACICYCLITTGGIFAFSPFLVVAFWRAQQISGCQIKRRADPRWLHGVTSRPRGYLQGHTKEVLGKCRGNRGSSRKSHQVTKFCKPSSVAYQRLERDLIGMSQACFLLPQTDGESVFQSFVRKRLGKAEELWRCWISTEWCFASILVAQCSSAPLFIMLYERLAQENVTNCIHFVYYLNKEPFYDSTMTLNRVPLFCQCGV